MNAFARRSASAALAVASAGLLASCGTTPRRAAAPPTARTTITPSVEPRLDIQPDPGSPAPEDEAAGAAREVAEVIERHNAIREAEKLPPMKLDAKLAKAAERHAADMAANEKMDHKGSDGSDPFERMEAAGYKYKRAAENVAAGEFMGKLPMDLWMDSPGHKKNILGDYEQIGVARATGKDGKDYWCVTFGTPLQP